MDRRTFVKGTGLAAVAHVLPTQAAAFRLSPTAHRPAPPDPQALIMDAMGELRQIYEPPLVREMLASGIDSITVTLCDPKAVGAEALELAVDGLSEYDGYLAAHPDLFVKATTIADVDQARQSGRMAVFYLYQNATQFDDDLARVFEPFYTTKSTGAGLGLTVVKDIIDNHQGEIRIDNGQTRGTTVTIVLPLYTE